MSKLKFAQRSSLLIAGSILKMITQIVILMLYARQLSLTEYGTYQTLWLSLNVISVISLFGLPSMILSAGVVNVKRWIADNKHKFWLWAALVNLLPVAYMLMVPHRFPITTILLLLCLNAIQSAAIISEAIAVKKEQENLVFRTNILFSVLFLAAHLLILFISFSLPMLIKMLIIVFLVKTIILRRFTSNQEDKENSSVQNGKQWLFLGFNDITGVLFKWFDKWIILIFLTLPEFAIYFNGSYEIPVFGLMAGAAGNIMIVEYSKQHKNREIKTKSLFENSATLLSGIVYPSFCFLLFYRYDFFTLIFSPKYMEAVPVFLITILVLPIRITNYTAILQANSRTDIILKGAIMDLLAAIFLMFILYPLYKTTGLALACVISTYGQSAYYLWQTGNLIKKPVSYFFPFKKLFIIMAISVAVMAAGYMACKTLSYPLHMIPGIGICISLMAFFIYRYYTDSKKEIIAKPQT